MLLTFVAGDRCRTPVGQCPRVGQRRRWSRSWRSDFLFVPPYYRLSVSSPVDWVTLLVFLVVALSRASADRPDAAQRARAVQRQREIALLNRLSSRPRLRGVGGGDGVLHRERGRRRAGGRPRGAVLRARAATAPPSWSPRPAGPGAGWPSAHWRSGSSATTRRSPCSGRGCPPSCGRSGAERRGRRRATRRGRRLRPAADQGQSRGCAVRAPAAGPASATPTARQLLAVANLAAAFLERLRLEEAAAHRQRLRESDRLKATLVSSVSHELKTPLAAVTARVTGLIEEGEGCDAGAGARGAHGGLGGPRPPAIRPSATCSTSRGWSRTPGGPKLDDYDVAEVLGTVPRISPWPSERA